MSSLAGFNPTRGPSGSTFPKQKISGYNLTQLPTMNQDTYNLYQMLLGGAQGGLPQGLQSLGRQAAGDEGEFAALEAPAHRAFQRNASSLASQFSGLGMGARGSSGFQNALGEASREMSENLQSRRLGLQQNALQQLLGLSQGLLQTPTFENILSPKQPSIWEKLLGSFGPGIGNIGSLYGASKLGLLG